MSVQSYTGLCVEGYCCAAGVTSLASCMVADSLQIVDPIVGMLYTCSRCLGVGLPCLPLPPLFKNSFEENSGPLDVVLKVVSIVVRIAVSFFIADMIYPFLESGFTEAFAAFFTDLGCLTAPKSLYALNVLVGEVVIPNLMIGFAGGIFWAESRRF